jgi:alpha-tubulin suppressor-like RCC1 family protein
MGSNSHGQLGISHQSGGENFKTTPTLVEGLLSDQIVTKVICGNFHSLAISSENRAYAWGQGKFGALGNGRSENQYEPQLIANLSIADASAGGSHSAFITLTK